MKKIKTLKTNSRAMWFFCQDEQLWTDENLTQIPVGTLNDLNIAFGSESPCYLLGYYNKIPCILVDVQHQIIELPSGQWSGLRSVMSLVDTELFLMAGRAWQVANFIRTHQFCGQCGERMVSITWEVASQCKHCNHRAYPRISPAVIMAVVKDGKVLLAQNKRNVGGIYSVLAGFVEVGETLEQTVAREVKEEVGIEVTNIRYFGSQPWPYPHNMMIGYIADYKSGKIQVDPHELIAADWYDQDNLPEIPHQRTIARQMINAVLGIDSTDEVAF